MSANRSYEQDRRTLAEFAMWLEERDPKAVDRMIQLGIIRVGQDAGPLELYVPNNFMALPTDAKRA